MFCSRTVSLLALGLLSFGLLSTSEAFTIRGTGAGALYGGDLTDPQNDGDPELNIGYDAIFTSSEEPGFGGGEFAFNVFDNRVGPGNDKWCCGDQNNFPVNPIWIDATFAEPIKLTLFTLTSGNDSPDRDPRVFEIQGTNDGVGFTTIFARNDSLTTPWTERSQVLQFDEGIDFPVQTESFSTIRFVTTATGLTTGARFQLAEIEYIPEPSGGLLSAAGFAALAAMARRRRRQS